MNAYLHDKHNHAYHIFMLTKYFIIIIILIYK